MIPGVIADIQQVCQNIIAEVNEKLKLENNPLLFRIQHVVREYQFHLRSLSSASSNPELQKKHWGVLYRAGDAIDEMSILLHNTTPVPIKDDVDYLKQQLVFFTTEVVQLYGKRESLYIITPKFQELAKLW